MRNGAVLLVLTCALSIAGCPSQPNTMPMFDTGSGGDGGSDGGADASTQPDTGMDAGPLTTDAGSDVGPSDAATTDAYRGDAGRPVITTSDPAPPPEIIRMGTGGLLLRGIVLTPTGALSPGEVLIAGNTITCVAVDCTTTAPATATIIDTHATISPGLIDAHNHLTYDFLGEWIPPHLYVNRYEWSDDPSYMAWIAPYADHRAAGDHVCPAVKWGELRSIIHGTTTIEGESPSQSCVDRLARNADLSYNGIGDTMQTSIGSVRAITDTSTAPSRTTLTAAFTGGTTIRFAVHMQEGYANSTATGVATEARNLLLEFESYAGRDATLANRTISLLQPPGGSPYQTALFIHSMGLTPAQLDEAAAQHARLVWSPSSNMVLYGQTADIEGWLARGITVGLGPDWTPSGSDEMLSEMRYSQQYGADHAITALTAEQIWRMSTIDGADVVGMSPVGTIAVGQRADISVFGRTSTDPYQAVIDSRADDVRLVLIDGVGYYGDTSLQAATAVNTFCEAFDACGTPKYLCAANTPGSMTATSRYAETVADIRGQLLAILATYSRTDLLELVDCSL